MKKLIILVFLWSWLLSACSTSERLSSVSSSATESQYLEIMASGPNYRIYKGNLTEVTYEIYDANETVVLKETTNRPLEIQMVNEHIVDIGIGLGTGLTVHRYYDTTSNVFSRDYEYVIANWNTLTAYLDGELDSRVVIVENIFNRQVFHQEFPITFSKIDTPVIDAAFSEDGTTLQLTYLTGEDQEQVTQTLSLIA